MKTQTNSEAVRDWKRYIDVKAAMVIKPTPKHFACTAPIVLVVASVPSFVMSEFECAKTAEEFCSRYQLPHSRQGC